MVYNLRMGGRRRAAQGAQAAILASILAVLALLSGCRHAVRDAGPTATVGTLPPVTTTTDPYAVPPAIDAPYVNRVLAGLDQAYGDMTRTMVAARTIPRDIADGLHAFYLTDAAWQLMIDGLQEDMRTGFANYRPNPGNQRSVVVDLLRTGRQCVFAKIHRDYSAVGIRLDPSVATQWVALVPVKPSDDPDHRNPTGWGYVYEGFQRGFVAPSDPCAGF